MSGVTLFVSNGTNKFKLSSLDPNELVVNVKKKIQSKDGTPVVQQELYWQSTQLQNTDTIAHIPHRDTLELIVNKEATKKRPSALSSQLSPSAKKKSAVSATQTTTSTSTPKKSKKTLQKSVKSPVTKKRPSQSQSQPETRASQSQILSPKPSPSPMSPSQVQPALSTARTPTKKKTASPSPIKPKKPSSSSSVKSARSSKTKKPSSSSSVASSPLPSSSPFSLKSFRRKKKPSSSRSEPESPASVKTPLRRKKKPKSSTSVASSPITKKKRSKSLSSMRTAESPKPTSTPRKSKKQPSTPTPSTSTMPQPPFSAQEEQETVKKKKKKEKPQSSASAASSSPTKKKRSKSLPSTRRTEKTPKTPKASKSPKRKKEPSTPKSTATPMPPPPPFSPSSPTQKRPSMAAMQQQEPKSPKGKKKKQKLMFRLPRDDNNNSDVSEIQLLVDFKTNTLADIQRKAAKKIGVPSPCLCMLIPSSLSSCQEPKILETEEELVSLPRNNEDAIELQVAPIVAVQIPPLLIALLSHNSTNNNHKATTTKKVSVLPGQTLRQVKEKIVQELEDDYDSILLDKTSQGNMVACMEFCNTHNPNNNPNDGKVMTGRYETNDKYYNMETAIDMKKNLNLTLEIIKMVAITIDAPDGILRNVQFDRSTITSPDAFPKFVADKCGIPVNGLRGATIASNGKEVLSFAQAYTPPVNGDVISIKLPKVKVVLTDKDDNTNLLLERSVMSTATIGNVKEILINDQEVWKQIYPDKDKNRNNHDDSKKLPLHLYNATAMTDQALDDDYDDEEEELKNDLRILQDMTLRLKVGRLPEKEDLPSPREPPLLVASGSDGDKDKEEKLSSSNDERAKERHDKIDSTNSKSVLPSSEDSSPSTTVPETDNEKSLQKNKQQSLERDHSQPPIAQLPLVSADDGEGDTISVDEQKDIGVSKCHGPPPERRTAQRGRGALKQEDLVVQLRDKQEACEEGDFESINALSDGEQAGPKLELHAQGQKHGNGSVENRDLDLSKSAAHKQQEVNLEEGEFDGDDKADENETEPEQKSLSEEEQASDDIKKLGSTEICSKEENGKTAKRDLKKSALTEDYDEDECNSDPYGTDERVCFERSCEHDEGSELAMLQNVKQEDEVAKSGAHGDEPRLDNRRVDSEEGDFDSYVSDGDISEEDFDSEEEAYSDDDGMSKESIEGSQLEMPKRAEECKDERIPNQRVVVETRDGHSLPVEFEMSDTMDDLKLKIANAMQLPAGLIRLSMEGVELDKTHVPSNGDYLIVETPRIKVQLPGGSRVQIPVMPAQTIYDVKSAIEGMCRLDHADQHLFFLEAKEELEDDAAVTDYEFSEGSMLEVRIVPPGTEVQLPDGRSFNLIIDPDKSVGAIRSKIVEAFGLPLGRIKIDGKDWGGSLMQRRIRDLEPKLKSGDILVVEAPEVQILLPNGSTVSVKVLPRMTIKDIKKAVEEKFGDVEAEKQCLFLPGERESIGDSTLVAELDLRQEVVLEMRVAKLFVTSWDGETYPIFVRLDAHSEDLKHQIHNATMIPTDQQRLAFMNHPIVGGSSIKEQGILHLSRLTLEPMLVRIMLPRQDQLATLSVQMNEFVYEVKRKAAELANADVKRLHLLTNGNVELQESLTLAQCKVKHGDHLRLEAFLVQVAVPSGDVLNIRNVDQNDPLATLELRIVEQCGIPIDNHRLVVHGKVLQNNDKSLRECGVTHRCMTYLEEVEEGAANAEEAKEEVDDTEIVIVIQKSKRESFSIQARLSNSIDSIKEHVSMLTAIPANQQLFSFQGKPLVESVTLFEQGIVDGVTLVLQPMQIKIQLPSGDHHSFVIKPEATIERLKEIISMKLFFDVEDQYLFNNGKELRNEKTLIQCFVKIGDVLCLETYAISVLCWSGDVVELTNVRIKNTMDDVRDMLAEIKSVPKEQQRLMRGGQVLDNSKKTLQEYGILHKDIIMLDNPEKVEAPLTPRKTVSTTFSFLTKATSLLSAVKPIELDNDQDAKEAESDVIDS